MTLKRFAFVLLCIITGLDGTNCCFATGNPPSVTITDPSFYQSGTSGTFITPETAIGLKGMAGVLLTGAYVKYADLSNWPSSQPGQIYINATQVAEQATLKTKDFGDDDSACIGASGTFYLNGVAIGYGAADTVYQLCSYINFHTHQTGVIANPQFDGTFTLTSLAYGSSANVFITDGADILPGGITSASDNGADAAIQVTNSSNQPITDALWLSPDGLSFHDSLNNKIDMWWHANWVQDIGAQIEMTDQRITKVTWSNSVTGENGTCTGTQAWSASGINLVRGDNTITVTATNAEGLTGSSSIVVASNPARRLEITIPTTQSTYSTNRPTIDIGGNVGVSASIVGSAVVSSDFSYLPDIPLDNYISINVICAAQKATLFTKDFGADDSACIGASGTFNLVGSSSTFNPNGSVEIEYTPTMTVAQLVDAINLHTAETNVIATSNGCGQIVFSSRYYGSSSAISVSNGADILSGGYSDAAVGVDAAATVTCQEGSNISDAVWNSGSGPVLMDSLGNKIELTESAATSISCLNRQLWLNANAVTWSNQRTGQTGMCARATNWTAEGIQLLPGENNILVSSTSSSGQVETKELLVNYYPPVTSGTAKQMSEGSYISLTKQVVTAGNADTGDTSAIYVEPTSRACGLRVTGASANRGDVLDINGIITTSNGEVAIDAGEPGSVKHSSAPDLKEPFLVTALGMNNKAIGGGAIGNQCGMTDARGKQIFGINNIGLLVRTWGKVKSASSETHTIVIDDGSGVGVTCQIPQNVDLPSERTNISVTGISSIKWVSDTNGDPELVYPTRLIIVRDHADIVPF
ncbi:MAG: hypothetical protein ABFD83_07515 [Armatimonadota bacterium]